jgi:hypothetical protein
MSPFVGSGLKLSKNSKLAILGSEPSNPYALFSWDSEMKPKYDKRGITKESIILL